MIDYNDWHDVANISNKRLIDMTSIDDDKNAFFYPSEEKQIAVKFEKLM